ncbi:MAG: SAM-dependent chlorinase/fluorinase, partial [Deltaproteobacteria bacterium]|nr:SAM-dependent chlorinase/fluorinase [Deltaproteobacteria bacterium]
GDIPHAAGVIQEAYNFFPKGAIHVGVVDPGVGSDRRPILVKTEDYFFVGPDNGLFWPIIRTHQPVEIIHLTEKKIFRPRISPTFHGRDIFAPVAAHLSCGIDPMKMGAIITDPVPLQLPTPQQKGEVLSGQVIRVDNFGNLITNIHRQDLMQFSATGQTVIKVGGLIIEEVQETYADAKTGEMLALIGSSGHLEIAVNQGRASERLGVDIEGLTGLKVEVGKAGNKR